MNEKEVFISEEAETLAIADIFMRILGGGSLEVCMPALFTCIHSIALDAGEFNRFHTSDMLKKLADDLMKFKEENPAQMSLN